MKGCGEKSSDPADPSHETALQLLGLLGCVYRQGGRDPEKVVITDAVA